MGIPDWLVQQSQIANAGSEIRAGLLRLLDKSLRELSEKNTWEMRWDVSEKRLASIRIDFKREFPCYFCVEFYNSQYNDVCYGALKKNADLPVDKKWREELINCFGVGTGGGENEPWPWWRRLSESDEFFPFLPDWRSAPSPWIAIANGSMTKSFEKAALKFQDVFLRLEGSTYAASPATSGAAQGSS